jgi:hypothetical protein
VTNAAVHAYIHYNTGATQIDRIYISHILYCKKASITIPAAFTDHLAVVLRINVQTPLFRQGRRTWKMKAVMTTAETKYNGETGLESNDITPTSICGGGDL